MKNSSGFLVVLLFMVSLGGCATVPKTAGQIPAFKPPQTGFFHKVERGETLWRIARTYGVELDELVRINRIPDSSRIEIGQKILISERPRPAVSSDLREEDFIWPLKGRVVSGFGVVSNGILNKGINIEPSGTDSVVASRSGKVVFFHEDFLDMGKTVIIEHPGGFCTVYARNSDVFVKPGDTVQRAGLIAKVGSSGRNKTSYLHFQIRKGSFALNPYHFLP